MSIRYRLTYHRGMPSKPTIQPCEDVPEKYTPDNAAIEFLRDLEAGNDEAIVMAEKILAAVKLRKLGRSQIPKFRVLSITDDNGEVYVTQHRYDHYTLSESIERAMRYYPDRMSEVENIEVEIR